MSDEIKAGPVMFSPNFDVDEFFKNVIQGEVPGKQEKKKTKTKPISMNIDTSLESMVRNEIYNELQDHFSYIKTEGMDTGLTEQEVDAELEGIKCLFDAYKIFIERNQIPLIMMMESILAVLILRPRNIEDMIATMTKELTRIVLAPRKGKKNE